jgi:hypothetical protein
LTLHTQSTGPELEFGETPPPYPDENVPSDSDFEDKFITDWESEGCKPVIAKCKNWGGTRRNLLLPDGEILRFDFSLGTRSSIPDEEPGIEVANFPWDVQMPPCEHRIESFQELEEHLASVPDILEAFTATYPPCWSR